MSGMFGKSKDDSSVSLEDERDRGGRKFTKIKSRAISRVHADARGLFSDVYRFQSAREQPVKRRKERERQAERVQGRGIQVVHNITVTAFYPAVNRRQALRLYDLIPQTLPSPPLPAHPLRPPLPPLTTDGPYPRSSSPHVSLCFLSLRPLLFQHCTRVLALTQCRGMALSAGCFYDRARVKRGPGRKGLKDALISWPTQSCR